jgi:hypothetical protein
MQAMRQAVVPAQAGKAKDVPGLQIAAMERAEKITRHAGA